MARITNVHSISSAQGVLNGLSEQALCLALVTAEEDGIQGQYIIALSEQDLGGNLVGTQISDEMLRVMTGE